MWIEDTEYQRILEQMPIPTVDAIILFQGRFLLLKRKNPPVKGEVVAARWKGSEG